MNSSSTIWLASCSPRRQALLRQIQLPFTVLKIPPDRDPEQKTQRAIDETATQFVLRLSRQKAETAVTIITENRLPIMPVLTADTVVTDREMVYGKPKSLEDARKMLSSLSGRTHHVITAVTLHMPNKVYYQTIATTAVTFATLTKEKINRYIASCNVLDKAGSYAIQEYAGLFVSEIRGSYSNVVGLPLFETAKLLNTAGIQW